MAQPKPQTILSDMVSRFAKASQGLLTAPAPQFIEREKGFYAYFYSRLSKRLCTTLCVDREVLILFTSYQEQQQRTIKTARELIDDSDGRLEPTIAVIVHRDPEGNLKLKRWGRNLRLAILPIYYEAQPSKPEEIERLLSHELFSHDPFDVTGPVSDDENFFGRRNEAQDLARKLQTGQIRACLGIRKIGKTSVINRIIADARANHDCYCIMLDCSRDEIWRLNAEQLISGLCEGVQAAQTSDMRYAVVEPPRSSAGIAEAARKLLSAIKSSSKPVIVFVDEVDYITPGSPTASHWRNDFNPFWRNIRAIYQEAARDGQAFSMLISGVSSKWFSVESVEGIENASLALIPEEYLSPLPRGASMAMIRKMARSAGLMLGDDHADVIAAACSDMPYWVRKACSYIHRQIDMSARPVSLSRSQVAAYVDAFIENEGNTIAQVAVGHLFRVYPELEAPCIAALKSGAKPEEVGKRFSSILEKYGLGPTSKGQHSAAMIRAGIDLHVESKTTSVAETVQVVPTGVVAENWDQWADDLAVINKLRNGLEKRLRSVVLNFLRADSLANKNKGTLKYRLLQAIPSEQRSKFDNVAADELIEKFHWLELSAVVKREWTIFQALFGDRNQFELQTALINDRPDAHAKPLDAADFALYRRALKWVNDKLAG